MDTECEFYMVARVKSDVDDLIQELDFCRKKNKILKYYDYCIKCGEKEDGYEEDK